MPMRPPLYESVSDQIRQMVREGRPQKGSRLPGEDELARLLQVGRSTLREALRALEQEGLITRRHGVGNFVSHNFDRMRGNLETLESFIQSIRRSGYTAHMETIGARLREISPEAAEVLMVEPGSLAWYIELLYYGNEKPAIFSRTFLPAHEDEAGLDLELHWRWESTRSFLEQQRGIQINCASLSVRAVRAEPDVAALLNADPGSPLLLLEGPSFGEDGTPVYHTEAFFNTEVYQFHLVRR